MSGLVGEVLRGGG